LLQIRLADQDDYQRWNDYVRRNTEASPYHLMAWNLASEAAYKHKKFCLIAEQHDEILGVLPICLMALPLTKGSLCSLPFCDIGGCLGDNEKIKQQLVDAALELADRLKVSALQIRSRAPATSEIDPEYTGKVSMLLPLPESSELLLASFKSKLRSQIRRAEKNGLTFRFGRKTEELDQFYQVLSSNMRDLGSPVHSIKWFESIRKQYGDDMVIGIVSKGDIPVGAGMLLFLKDIAAIPWASTLSEYNRLAPNMLLYWNLIKYATDKRCTVFDFGRSTYGEGTFKFKKQWGASPVPLDWKNYLVDSRKSRVGKGSLQNLRRIFENVWRHLPLQLANTLGPYIRKHISL
jgi:FemAB-related protein (PEP-CTERM system-associated)